MPVTYAKAPSAATRYPPASQTEPAVASKKKKKKKGKGKAHDGSNPSNHMNHVDHDGIDDDEDDLGPANPAENELNGRRTHDGDYGDPANYPNSQTAPLNAASHGQPPLRMSTTATAQAELLAAANELYKRMETEQMANDTSDGEYWKQLPSHIRSFVETTYAHGAALSPNERSKSQAMLALAQTMVDEATSRFPTGGFPPPFDPSLLSDPKFAERLGMKHGGIGAMNLMREYADEAYDDYNSENDEDDIDDEQQYEADDSSKKKKKKKKRGVAATVTNGTTPHPNPLPPIIPLAPNQAATVTRAAPSAAQPRPSSRAAGKQPVYSQPTVPPARTTRSAATKSPVPPNPYNHGYAKSALANGNSTLAKRPTGGGGDKDGRSKLWSSSTEQDRERIKEFWLGLSDVERRDLVKLEKEAVLKKMKEQQKHSCSCAVCGRKRNAIEEELEVLYDAYYEELEQYANHQQQYQSSGGKITPPPGPGPFPGSVAVDKNGAVIGGPPGATKHPARGGRPAINGARGRKAPADSEDEYEDEYDDDEDEYEDEEEEEEEEDDDDDDSNTRKVAPRRRDLPPRAPVSRRPNGREDFFNFGNLTTAGPGNILTVADDLLKNDGGKFLEMMEQLAERRMQREEDAAKEVEVDSEEDEDDPEGSEEDEEDDEDNDDDESEEEEEDPMSEEQKMEEGRKMFSIFAARMFEQRVLNAYREKVAAERQEQLLRELEDEDKVQAEKDAKRQKENQKKKDKKKQQKQAKEAEKAKKDVEKANEEAARRAELEAHEEEMRKKRDEERLKRESERKQKEEEKAKVAEERRQRIAEQKAIEAERKREKEERERKERLARQEKEAQAKAEKAERDRKAKEERATREAKEREERDKREKDDKERKDRERLEQAKVEERKKQEALTAAATAKARATTTPTSPRASNYPPGAAIQQAKKPVNNIGVKPNGPLPPSQRPVANPMNRPPQMQQVPQPILVGSQRPMMGQGQGMPINLQLPPNMGIAPLGMAQPFNPMVSPIVMSPRIGYGPPSATGVGHGPFSPHAPFAQGQGQPGMMNGSIVGNMQQYSFDAQSPLMPQPQPAGAMILQPSRPSSTLPPTLTMPPPKAPGTPTTNGIPPIGVSPGGSSSTAVAAAHIRRASAQANPSPFGAIGKPRGAPSSVVGDDDRGLGGLPIMSPPSPDRVLGSSALVDENDTIVELPKRRSTSGRIDTIGAPAAVGSRWGSRGTTSWPAPNGPGPVGMQWSAAPGRPQPNRLDSSFSPS